MKRYRVASVATGLILAASFSFGQTVAQRDSITAAVVTGNRPHVSISSVTVDPGNMPLAASATGETDIIKFVQTLPGVASGTGGGNAFYVRGGNLGANLQTLDGVPIYATSHLLGLTSSYPLDIVSRADFQLGGFSSDEGNLTASHVRLTSKDGDFKTLTAKAYASNFLLGGCVSTPLIKDKLSLNASLRVSPVQFEYAALSGLVDHNFAFNLDKAITYDTYGKLCYRIDERQKLSVSVFHTLDGYKYLLDDRSEDSMQWWEFLGLVQYDRPLGGKGRFTASASFNRFSNSQGMMKRLGQTDNNLLIRSSLSEVILQADAVSPVGRLWEFRYGLKFREARFNPGSARLLRTDGLLFKSSSPMVDHISVSMLATVHGQVTLGDIQKRGLKLAGRLNYQNADGFAPEISAEGRFELFKGFGLEGSYDRLRQYYHTLEGIPLGWSLDMLIPSSERFGPEWSEQVSAGLYLDISKHVFHVSGYSKKMGNLLWFTDASRIFDSAIIGWEQEIKTGSGTSRGLEVQYRKEGKVLEYDFAYTLSKTDRQFLGLNGGKAFPAKFDRRHIFNASFTGHILSDQRKELSVGTFFTYQSGHWETVPAGSWAQDNFVTGPIDIDFYTGVNNYEMPAYIRLDLSARLKLKNRRHEQEISAGIYNVLNRHNASWLSYNASTGEWYQISLLPIMPSLKYLVSF